MEFDHSPSMHFILQWGSSTICFSLALYINRICSLLLSGSTWKPLGWAYSNIGGHGAYRKIIYHKTVNRRPPLLQLLSPFRTDIVRSSRGPIKTVTQGRLIVERYYKYLGDNRWNSYAWYDPERKARIRPTSYIFKGSWQKINDELFRNLHANIM